MSGTRLLRFAALLAVAFISQAAAAGRVDVCTIKSRIAQSVGDDVSFKGRILSDGMHGILLVPNGCPDFGLPVAPDDIVISPFSIIWAAVMKVSTPGTIDKRITIELDATVTTLRNGHHGLKVTNIKKLVLEYPAEQ